MEVEGRTGDEDDNGGRGEGEVAAKEPEKDIKLKEANHSNREISRLNQQYQLIKALNLTILPLHVHLIRHRLIPENALISGLNPILINSHP